MSRKKVMLKEYISLTKENMDKIMNLNLYELGIMMWILMEADEYGLARTADVIRNKQITQNQFDFAIKSLEKEGLIVGIGNGVVAVIGWEQYNL